MEENGVGKFSHINDNALRALVEMGYTHVWCTGVLEHATLTDYSQYGISLDHPAVVKGRAGSPYAVKDYYDVDPDLAEDVPNRMAEFDALIKRIHSHGLKLILDFVPNHLARQYKSDNLPEDIPEFGHGDDPSLSFNIHNNFYYLPGTDFTAPNNENLPSDLRNRDYLEAPARASGNDVFSPSPSINDWYETIKLNYGIDYQTGERHFSQIPDTWYKMWEILRFWSKRGIDAFRCDMAEMVPVEFWGWVIARVKEEFPQTLFISEAYSQNAYRPYLFEGKFDYLYDKVDLYDTLKGIIQGHLGTDAITQVWQKQEGIADHMLRFLENHDEQRIASPFFAGNKEAGIPMMAISVFMHRGPVMMYFGQDVGEPASGPSGFSGDDGRTTIFDYWGVPEHVKWVNNGEFDGGRLSEEQKTLQKRYKEILIACNTQTALREGDFFDLQYYNRCPDYTGYSDKVYVFLRHCDKQKLLIAVNLGKYSATAIVKIPSHAFEIMGINKKKITISGRSFSLQSLNAYNTPEALNIELNAFDYKTFEIK